LAREYFIEHGYEILHNNWRYSHLELDIIASKTNTLHFIEVKTLMKGSVGLPEESVNKKKMMNLMKAAELFMLTEKRFSKIQFDILAVVLTTAQPSFFLLEDVYF
jgi:putative endonuclease